MSSCQLIRSLYELFKRHPGEWWLLNPNDRNTLPIKIKSQINQISLPENLDNFINIINNETWSNVNKYSKVFKVTTIDTQPSIYNMIIKVVLPHNSYYDNRPDQLKSFYYVVYKDKDKVDEEEKKSIYNHCSTEYIKDINKKESVTTKLTEHFNSLLNSSTEIESETITNGIISITKDTKIYVLGDLEGDLEFLQVFLLFNNLIEFSEEDGLIWIAPDNVYFIQLGDQIDRNHDTSKDTDLAISLFMDYLNIISKGHVISMIGNHEYMNITKDFKYVAYSDLYCSEDISKQIIVKLNMDTKFINGQLKKDLIKETYRDEYESINRPFYEIEYNPLFKNTNKEFNTADSIYAWNSFVKIQLTNRISQEMKNNLLVELPNKEVLFKQRIQFIENVLYPKVWKRRHIIVQAQDCVFSHAGWCYDKNLLHLGESLNISWMNDKNEFDNYIKKHPDDNPLWSRYFTIGNLKNLVNIPNVINVIGHNNLDNYQECSCHNGECNCQKINKLSIKSPMVVLTDINRLYREDGKIRFLTIDIKSEVESEIESEIESDDESVDELQKPKYILKSNIIEKYKVDEMKNLINNYMPDPNFYRGRILNWLNGNQGGGKLYNKFKKTRETININGRNRVIYQGKKGGKYIKYNKKFISLATFIKKNKFLNSQFIL